ncbi:MAG: VWA domain-containing protein [Pseudomonadota bacterium]
MNRKTAFILGLTGTLIAASIVFANKQQRANQQTLQHAGSSGLCNGKAGPARTSQGFEHGTLSAALSSSQVTAGSQGEVFASIDLVAKDAPGTERPPLNLALVIDRSGSMAGEKLSQAREAAKGLISRLQGGDRAAIVQYDSEAQVLVSSTVASVEGKPVLLAALDGISPGGSTNLHDGLALGRDEIMRTLQSGQINRLILLSDGQANRGIVDIPTLNQVAENAAGQGVRVTTVGLGLDYNEDLMEAIAEGGRGQYYYVKDESALKDVFAGEMRSLQATVATRAELRLEPACNGVEVVEVLGYQTRREGTALVVPMADLLGGDSRKVVAKVRVPTNLLGHQGVLTTRLSYQDARSKEQRFVATALGVEISSDALAVEKTANQHVMANAIQAESARSIREATVEYERGNTAGAQAILQAQGARAVEQQTKFRIEEKALAPAKQKMNDIGQAFNEYSNTSSAGKDIVKGNKAAARSFEKKAY